MLPLSLTPLSLSLPSRAPSLKGSMFKESKVGWKNLFRKLVYAWDITLHDHLGSVQILRCVTNEGVGVSDEGRMGGQPVCFTPPYVAMHFRTNQKTLRSR